MRSLAALVSLAAAYALLRGHPDSWPSVVRACLAVLSLFAGLGIWVSRPTESDAVFESRRPIRGFDYLVLGTVALAIEGFFLLFFSVAPAPLESAAASFEEWLRPQAAEQRKKDQAQRQNPQGGNWLWDDWQRRPLPARTNYKPGNRPEVFLQPSGDPSPLLASRLYVHAFALGDYGGGAWSVIEGARRELVADNDGWIRFEAASRAPAVACRVYHSEEPSGQNPALGLQGIAAVRVPALTELADGIRLLRPSEGDGYDYDTLSRPWLLDDVRSDEVEVPDDFPEEYLELPDGILGLRIRELASVVQGDGGPIERLKQIRNHLRTTLDYSLVTENPEDMDPLYNFMFSEQRGHCEFFATAGAMLARAAGVPSRICYGWSGGTYYESSRLFVFRAREAHAWAEVWIDDYGWVVLDPTPPVAFRAQRPELAAPNESPPGTDEVFDDPEVAGVGMLPWLLGLAALCAFPVAALWFARNRQRHVALDSMATDGAVLPYWKVFLEGCRNRGVSRSPGTTLRSLMQRLEDPPTFAPELLSYHYGVRYESQARDASVERQLAKSLREWSAQRRD